MGESQFRIAEKVNVLVVGFGGIDCITTYNLKASGLAIVTGVLRSNFQIFHERGSTYGPATMEKSRNGNLRAVITILRICFKQFNC
jgi:hypothetical protein